MKKPNNGAQVMADGMAALERFRELNASGQVKWEVATVPKPGAMRAYRSDSLQFNALVTEANVQYVGVSHYGMLMAMEQGMVIKMPENLARELFRSAVAQQTTK